MNSSNLLYQAKSHLEFDFDFAMVKQILNPRLTLDEHTRVLAGVLDSLNNFSALNKEEKQFLLTASEQSIKKVALDNFQADKNLLSIFAFIVCYSEESKRVKLINNLLTDNYRAQNNLKYLFKKVTLPKDKVFLFDSFQRNERRFHYLTEDKQPICKAARDTSLQPDNQFYLKLLPANKAGWHHSNICKKCYSYSQNNPVLQESISFELFEKFFLLTSAPACEEEDFLNYLDKQVMPYYRQAFTELPSLFTEDYSHPSLQPEINENGFLSFSNLVSAAR